MIQGIDNIGICTTDLARSVTFYRKLGFSEAYRNDRGVMMSVGDAYLFIFATRQSSRCRCTLFQATGYRRSVRRSSRRPILGRPYGRASRSRW